MAVRGEVVVVEEGLALSVEAWWRGGHRIVEYTEAIHACDLLCSSRSVRIDFGQTLGERAWKALR